MKTSADDIRRHALSWTVWDVFSLSDFRRLSWRHILPVGTIMWTSGMVIPSSPHFWVASVEGSFPICWEARETVCWSTLWPTRQWHMADLGPDTGQLMVKRNASYLLYLLFICCSSELVLIYLTNLNFISTSNINSKGKYLTVTIPFFSGERQGCGGVLNSTSGRFGSVDIDGDGAYEAQNCKWTIIVGDNKVVKLQFESMDLEQFVDCRYDYVVVRTVQKTSLLSYIF